MSQEKKIVIAGDDGSFYYIHEDQLQPFEVPCDAKGLDSLRDMVESGRQSGRLEPTEVGGHGKGNHPHQSQVGDALYFVNLNESAPDSDD